LIALGIKKQVFGGFQQDSPFIVVLAPLPNGVRMAATKRGPSMFGLFKKKKPPTMMDAMIRLVYGPNPPPKSADLERSIAIAYRDLLCERVPLARVKQRAGELLKGPIPHSTHDLAVSTALGFFRDPEYMPTLQECQIVARLRVADWAKDGSVPLLLAQSFEEVLYRRYKPQRPESPERPKAHSLPSFTPICFALGIGR
jgi:hypothetical protein